MAEPRLSTVIERLATLVDCLCLQVEEVRPLCYCGPYFGGDTPMDFCGECDGGKCGQAWVRLVAAYPSGTFPTPDDFGTCATPMAFQWEVGVARCAPVPAADGEPPSRDENLDATLLQYEDMDAMRRAIQCCFGSSEVDYLLGTYQPLPVAGGCNGATWTVFSR